MPLGIGTGGDKVEIIRLRRVHGRAQRLHARVGYRSRRQAGAKIGVVGGIVGQIVW